MSQNLNAKLMGGLVAAALVAGGGGVAVYNNGPKPVAAVEDTRRAPYVPRSADQRSYGGMSQEELGTLNHALRTIAPSKVHIFCGGNFCRDLAEDLDEAFESAGFDAYLEVPLFDIGKGAGISPASDRARAAAAAISAATGGRIVLDVFDPVDQAGKPLKSGDDLAIALARRKPGR